MALRKLGAAYQLGSIDPGNEEQARRSYVAYWLDSELRALELLSAAEYAAGKAGHRCDVCALETPVIYPNEKDPAPPNTIIGVNIAGCLLAGALSGGNVKTYRPKDWKGNRAKPPNHLDIWEELTPRERLVLGGEDTLAYINQGIALNSPRFYKKPLRQYAAAITNYLDAAGIGLVYLGRMR